MNKKQQRAEEKLRQQAIEALKDEAESKDPDERRQPELQIRDRRG